MSRPSDGALKSPMGSDGIRETQETDSAPIELGQYQDVIEPSPPLTPYCSDPILVEHKNRGSLSVFDKTVDEENILSFWYLPVFILPTKVVLRLGRISKVLL